MNLEDLFLLLVWFGGVSGLLGVLALVADYVFGDRED